MRTITASGLAVRFCVALLLVCLTWNPTRFNYARWAMVSWSEMAPVVLFVGLMLLVAFVVFLRATARSLGAVGIFLALAVAGSILWLLFYYELVSVTDGTALSWVVLVLFSGILTVGMSWSHLRRRWSGQADVDDVDDVG